MAKPMSSTKSFTSNRPLFHVHSDYVMTGLACKPLKSLAEVDEFLRDPPVWRSLCVGLTPHSEFAIRNMDIVMQNHHYASPDLPIPLERPQNFCHSSPDDEDVARHRRADLPKTLVCHDMANGYHDDSMIDGTMNFDAYTFYNWAVVDIFCYFSHHFVTIPPPGWINVAHQHGVKVIGTVITEWAEGTALWADILADHKGFASALVAIAKTLKFDGWLLNVENKVSNPALLLEFVQHLHGLLHMELEHAVLIWYDSVTVEGTLHWQNGLNSRNKAFFDACDGIFTNYTWSEADVRDSKAEAGARATDVYVGIDVWGRNFIGGGHFNTQQAVKVVFDHGCSMAIFAPAWTHEAIADEDMKVVSSSVKKMRPARQFLLRERALWGSLWPYLNTKLPCQLPFSTSFCRGLGRRRWLYGEVLGPSEWFNLRHQQYQPNAAHGAHGYTLALTGGAGPCAPAPAPALAGVSAHRDSLQTVTSLPSVATADVDSSSDSSMKRRRTLLQRIKALLRAAGPRRVSARHSSHSNSSGKSMLNISLNFRLGTSKDTARYTLVYLPDELECLEVYHSDCFTGGSCRAVHPCDVTNTDHRFIRLFHADLSIQGTLVACVVTKVQPEDAGQYLNVVLCVRDVQGSEHRVTLVGRDLPHSGRSISIDTILPLNHSDPEFRELQRHLLINQPSFYVATENKFGWKVRYYSFPLRGRVTSVNVRTGLAAGPVLLGHFGLCQIPLAATEVGDAVGGVPAAAAPCQPEEVQHLQSTSQETRDSEKHSHTSDTD